MHSLRFPPDELLISKITYGLHFEDEKVCTYLAHLLSLMYVKRKNSHDKPLQLSDFTFRSDSMKEHRKERACASAEGPTKMK